MVRENYKAWEIDSSDFPSNQSIEDQIKFLLSYAILAPSALNTQPWKFKINKNNLRIKPDFSRSLGKISDKSNRLLYISIGCVLKNLEVAAKHFGFLTSENTHFENDYIEVEMSFNRDNSLSNPNISLDSITNRTTNRTPYIPKRISENSLKKLSAKRDKDIEILIINNQTTKDRIIKLVKEIDQIIWNSTEFKKHHVTWVRHNLTKSGDGMPGNTVGVSLLPSLLAKFVFMTPFFYSIQSRKNFKLLKSTPYFGFILTKEHNPISWIRTGKIFEEISLIASENNLAITPMAEITEINDAYKKAKEILKIDLRPQLFFRLGYPKKSAVHSPRRKVEEFLN